MRSKNPLLGVRRDCMAMTSAAFFVPMEPCRCTIQAHSRTRRSIGAMRRE